MIGGNVPRPPKQPKTYTIPRQYVPRTYNNPSGGSVSGRLPYVLGVLNPGGAATSIGATSLGGFNPNFMWADQQTTTPSYGGGGGGGGSYDINSDPGVLAARAALASGTTQLDSWLRNQRTGAFVDFGDPNLAIPGFNLDPNVAEMARQNYKSGNSILSRLDTSHANAARGIINALAAHGILGSGDLGYRQGVENQAYGNNIYDAKKSLLGSLNQDYQSYLDRKNALQQAVTAAIQQAYANQMAMASQYSGY